MTRKKCTESEVIYTVKELIGQISEKNEKMHEDIIAIKVQTTLTNGKVKMNRTLIYALASVLFTVVGWVGYLHIFN